ncbi:MAG: hypothetical protein GX640_16085 [Fibrobacter sp.]|nr:hypothetical protein [Fibrobacter sp.]
MDMEKSRAENLNPENSQYADSKSKEAVYEAFSGNAQQQAENRVEEGVERFKNRGKGYAEQQKHHFAEGINHIGSALHKASSHLEERNDSNAGWVSDIADRIDHFADYIDHSSTDKILNDSADFARHHPVLTAGTLVAAGVAVSRFLRTGTESNREERIE